MAARTVQFLFDFGSPNAYLCHRVIPEIEQRAGIQFEYVPILLGGLFKLSNNQSPAQAFADIPNKRAYDQLEFDRFVRRHRIDGFQFNPHFPVNTLQVMRGALVMQQTPEFQRYVEAVYTAMWEQQQNMADPDVILEVLDKADLDSERILSGTQDQDIKAALLANTQSAFERGAFGSPTFFVGDEMFFGKERLGQVEEAALGGLED